MVMEKERKNLTTREEERRARQAEALRANLYRRKQQLRDREEADKRGGNGSPSSE